MPTQSKWESLPTEAINPVSLAIDKAPVSEIVDMAINEDRKIIAAIQKEKERIAHGVEIITNALRKGGRIIFIGAGTSGRLGVVEASEMPPTFGTSPKTVQAIMAGGQEAVFRAKEGVEDNYEEGARSISRLRLTPRDVVIGVSASGMTPFVRGGLTRARKAGGKIIFITCWPGSELQNFVDLQIAPAVGPELIAGSTRLKAGTATKMVLNMLTTIAMIKVGKTYGNLMVDVQTGSEKLKDRARRIIVTVTGLTYDEADALLKRAKWNVKAAIVMQKTTLTLPQALRRLKKAQDSVRVAIGEDAGSRRGARRRSRRPETGGRRLVHARSPRRGAAAGTTPARSVVDRPPHQPLDDRRLGRTGHDEHDPAGLQDRRDPHRQGLGRHGRRVATEERRVAAPRLGLERHAMGSRLEGRPRLVEPDVPVACRRRESARRCRRRRRSRARSARTPPPYRRRHRSGNESARPRGSRGRRDARS